MEITGPGTYERATPIFDRDRRSFDPITESVSAAIADSGRAVELEMRTRSGASVFGELTFPDPKVVRYRTGDRREHVTEMLVGPPPELPVTVDERDDTVLIAAGGTPVVIRKRPFSITFGPYATEPADTSIIEWIAEPGGFATDLEGGRPSVYETFALRPGEQLWGLGERFHGPNLRGHRLHHWIDDAWGTNTADLVYKSVPLVVSSRGYGVFFHHPEEAVFDLGAGSTASASVLIESDALDLFVLPGAPKEVLSRYTALTGRPAELPEWTYGVWMSRAGYPTADEVKAVVEKAAELGFPIEVVNIDPYWLTLQLGKNYNVCDFHWNERDFGDRAEFIGWLHSRGVKVCLWINSHLSDDSPEWTAERMVGGGVRDDLFPQRGWVELTGAGRDWWLEELPKLLAAGVDAFKIDYGETLPKGSVMADGRSTDEVHNLYPLLAAQVAAEAGATVHFTRGATAGSQRYPLHWSGDAQGTWAGLRGALRGGLSMAWSGFAHWTSDIGGFFFRDLTKGPDEAYGFGQSDTELYIRWMQFGMLCSHTRFHGMAAREPWEFGDDALAIAKSFAELRARLRGYLMRCAAEAAATGCPVMRPLALEFPDDPGCRHIDTQYLLGPSLLVCPALEAGGAVEAYLPPRTWTDHFTGERFDGPGWVRFDVPLDRLPLLVRDGHDPFV